MTETSGFSTAELLKGSMTSENTKPVATDAATALFAEDEALRFRGKWTDIQSEFVDEPKKSVEKADQLVAEAIKRLAEIFAGEREKLEHQWSRNDDGVSTEDLRIALRRYRSFFDRLLSV